jgi:hypothetical protein
MGARNQVGIGLLYRPAILRSLATQFQTRFLESTPRPIGNLSFRLCPVVDSVLIIYSINFCFPINRFNKYIHLYPNQFSIYKKQRFIIKFRNMVTATILTIRNLFWRITLPNIIYIYIYIYTYKFLSPDL